MKRALSILIPLVSPLAAQVPQAVVVDPVLQADAGNDFFLRGKNLYDAGRGATDYENRIECFQRAADIFIQYIDLFPNHPNAEKAWWYLGDSHYQSGQIDEAKRCFSTLMNRYARSEWAAAAAYTLAVDHYNRGEYHFAAPLFERYASDAASPQEQARGTWFAGNSYRMLGRDREATACYQKILAEPAASSFAPQAKVALGWIAANANRHEEALAYFEEVARSNEAAKTRAEAAYHAALAAAKLDRLALADDYLMLILSQPGMESFREPARTAHMGNHFARKNYAKVVEIFSNSASSDGGQSDTNRLMLAARSYLKLNQAEKASALFREIERESDPRSSIAFHASYYRLLCFYRIEGRHVPDQVDAFLQLYRDTHPDDPRIHTALMMKAETLFSKREIAAAAQAFNEVNAALLSPKNRPGLLYQRGWCLAEAGDNQGAIRSLGEFIDQFPDDSRLASALAKRATAYVAMAEPQLALADFDRCIEVSADADLVSFARLESARLQRAENAIPDMIARYQSLLEKAGSLSDSHLAEANYWMGWGMVKTGKSKEAVPFLEKAREQQADAYGKHAGILLALGYFTEQDTENLNAEIQRAMDASYTDDLPKQLVQWAGMQSFNSGDHPFSIRCLEHVATPDEPRATPKEVWRYLTKAYLEVANPKAAAAAVKHLLSVEENSAWKADALLDQGRALYGLKEFEQSRTSVDEALSLGPQGRTSAGLRILNGDLEMQAGDPRKAAAQYLIVANFHEDADLKPLALWKLVQALKASDQAAEAKSYEEQLKSRFPDWKPSH